MSSRQLVVYVSPSVVHALQHISPAALPTAEKKSPASIYCISTVKYETLCYNHSIIFCGDFFQTPMRIVNKCVLSCNVIIYQLLFVDKKQWDIFGNKHFFVPSFGMFFVLFVCI